jgi:hypothetical protein
MLDPVTSLRPYSQCPELLGYIDSPAYRLAVDRDQHIAAPYSSALRRRIGHHEDSLNAMSAIRPGNAIIRHIERKALLEINNAKDNGRSCEQYQDNCADTGTNALAVVSHKAELWFSGILWKE